MARRFRIVLTWRTVVARFHWGYRQSLEVAAERADWARVGLTMPASSGPRGPGGVRSVRAWAPEALRQRGGTPHIDYLPPNPAELIYLKAEAEQRSVRACAGLSVLLAGGARGSWGGRLVQMVEGGDLVESFQLEDVRWDLVAGLQFRTLGRGVVA